MADIGIFVGTIYGNSLLVAEETKKILKNQGHIATIYEDPKLTDWIQYKNAFILIITSTTGHGDLPDNIIPLFQEIKESDFQVAIHYGIIALGNSSYTNFCGGGKKFDAMLQEQRAHRIGEMLLIDAEKYPDPKIVSNQWVKHWITLLI